MATKRQWLKRIGCGFGIFLLLILLIFGVLVFKAYRDQTSSSAVANSFTSAPVSASPTTANTVVATDDDPSFGPKDARVTVVEFSDFECPFCRQSFLIVRELMAQYGDRVRFIYRDFPIVQIHANAQKAAEAGECANAQGKFWSMHDKIFQNSPAITVPDIKRYAQAIGLDTAAFNTCLDGDQFAQEVQQDFADGVALGVSGTPTWFINGRKVEGAIPRETFIQILDQFLAQ